MYKGYLTDIEGIKVGHAQNDDGLTGCTVVITPEGSTFGGEVRGGAPGTRETALFDTSLAAIKADAIVLAGGSSYGLAAATGVMDYLEEEGIGFNSGKTVTPSVPAAIIFDLRIGDHRIRPDHAMGYQAARKASIEENRQGNIGAGLGATIGKSLGPDYSMKGGLGSATVEVGDLKVSAMVVVNAVGDIFDIENNKQIAGTYDREKKELIKGSQVYKQEHIEKARVQEEEMPSNTTIGIIATNAKLNKGYANKVAEMAHNGFARAINPIHTFADGDTIFTVATNEVDGQVNLIGTMAAEAMSKAIINAVKSAEAAGGYISINDI